MLLLVAKIFLITENIREGAADLVTCLSIQVGHASRLCASLVVKVFFICLIFHLNFC